MADWLQGSITYALYESYALTQSCPVLSCLVLCGKAHHFDANKLLLIKTFGRLSSHVAMYSHRSFACIPLNLAVLSIMSSNNTAYQRVSRLLPSLFTID